jgi:hypothetical protein
MEFPAATAARRRRGPADGGELRPSCRSCGFTAGALAPKIVGMDEVTALNLLSKDWWVLAAVAWGVWTLEATIEGNSVFEIVAGPLMVATGIAAIVLVDRWVTSGLDRPTK